MRIPYFTYEVRIRGEPSETNVVALDEAAAVHNGRSGDN